MIVFRQRRLPAGPIEARAQAGRHSLQQGATRRLEFPQMFHKPARRVGARVDRHSPGAGGQQLRLHTLRDHRENIRLIFV